VATIELGAALIINALFRWIARALIRSERWRQAVAGVLNLRLRLSTLPPGRQMSPAICEMSISEENHVQKSC
jgi:hypothetical protein